MRSTWMALATSTRPSPLSITACMHIEKIEHSKKPNIIPELSGISSTPSQPSEGKKRDKKAWTREIRRLRNGKLTKRTYPLNKQARMGNGNAFVQQNPQIWPPHHMITLYQSLHKPLITVMVEGRWWSNGHPLKWPIHYCADPPLVFACSRSSKPLPLAASRDE